MIFNSLSEDSFWVGLFLVFQEVFSPHEEERQYLSSAVIMSVTGCRTVTGTWKLVWAIMTAFGSFCIGWSWLL